jgi:ribA/ribD-fused uncharacterized protein
VSAITNFRGQYGFLSNFFPTPITICGEVYPSVEHAFQAMKAVREVDRVNIQKALNPAAAKRMGKQIKMRQDWEHIKIMVMLDCLHAKFCDPQLRMALLSTGSSVLIEGNTWGDRFWGVCNGSGLNWLGELLMHVRWEIRVKLI